VGCGVFVCWVVVLCLVVFVCVGGGGGGGDGTEIQMLKCQW